jgi:DNA-binding Lrp family transcriptional regulator
MEEAFVLIRVQQDPSSSDPDFLHSVKQKVAKLQGVKQVKGVFGIYDLVAVVETKSVEELGILVTKNLKNIRGITQTDTMIVGF